MNVPNLRFSGFSDEWQEKKLREIAEIVGGGTPSTSVPEYWDGSIDWYAPAEIKGQRFVADSVRKITERGLQNCSAKILPADKTVLFTSRAGIGKTAILKKPGATNQGFQSLVLNDDINPYFVYSKSTEIKEKAEQVASGSTFLEISGKMLGELTTNLPQKDEQDLIAKTFQRLDDIILSQQKKCYKLDALKSACLDKMFPKAGEKRPEIRIGYYTEDWNEDELEALARVKDSARVPNALWVESGVPYIRASDVSNHDMTGVLFLSKESFEYYKGQTGAPSKGDVLFNGGGEIGCAFFKDDDTPIYVQGGAVLYVMTSASEKLDGQYLKTYFETTTAKKYLKISSAGGTIKHFTLKPAQCMPILFPEIEEQKEIGRFFCYLDSIIDIYRCKLKKLKQIKESMTHSMFV